MKMTHLKQATDRAIRLAKDADDFMAVVHCGCGEYTVKREALVTGGQINRAAVRRVVTPGGRSIENKAFDRAAI